jgi:hypothetical protein
VSSRAIVVKSGGSGGPGGSGGGKPNK